MSDGATTQLRAGLCDCSERPSLTTGPACGGVGQIGVHYSYFLCQSHKLVLRKIRRFCAKLPGRIQRRGTQEYIGMDVSSGQTQDIAQPAGETIRQQINRIVLHDQ